MRTRTLPAVLSLLLLLLWASDAASGGTGLPELGTRIDELRRQNGIAAAAFFVVSADRVIALDAFGQRSWDNDELFLVDDLVRIGSITKTLGALTTMTLVERGAVSLSDPVSSLVPDPPYSNPWSYSHPVRIVHLLEHTAGLADLSRREFDFNEPVSVAEAFAVDPESRRLRWPPGLYASYSNSGAGILSYVLEQLTGTSFAKLVREAIFSPLGMGSARFTLTDAERATLIAGYDSDGRTPIPYWHTLYPAFGGGSMSPRDMVAVVQLFLNHGRHRGAQIVSPAGMHRMVTPGSSLAARAGLTYGYGLGIYEYQHHGVSFRGHGGDADGYLSYFAYSDALDRGYFIVINAYQKRTLREMRRLIEDSLIADHIPAKPPPVHGDPAQRARLAGEYRASSRRFGEVDEARPMFVTNTATGLATRTSQGREQALVPVSRWLFRRRGETRATIAFIPCAGEIHLQGDFGNYVRRESREADMTPCRPATIPKTDQAVMTQRTPVPPIPQ